MTEEEMKAKIAELEDANTKLKADKHTVLGEKNKAAAAAKEAQDKLDAAEADAAAKSGNVETIKAALEKEHKKVLDALTGKLDAANTQLNTLLIDNAIKDHLVKANVDVIHHDILTDAFKAKAKLVDGVAMIGDSTIEDHFSTFASSEAAKHYITAPVNSGAGATGPKTVNTDTVPASWNFTKYTEMKASDPDGALAYAKKHNQPFA